MTMTWIKDRDPDADGTYIAALGYDSIEVCSLNYTTDAGWNTSRTDSGFADPITTLGYMIGGDGYIKAWMPMPTYSEKGGAE